MSGYASAATFSTATPGSVAEPAAWEWEYIGAWDTQNHCNQAGAQAVVSGYAAAYECNWDLPPAPFGLWGLWLGFNNN